jgi:hypothetical protein
LGERQRRRRRYDILLMIRTLRDVYNAGKIKTLRDVLNLLILIITNKMLIVLVVLK